LYSCQLYMLLSPCRTFLPHGWSQHLKTKVFTLWKKQSIFTWAADWDQGKIPALVTERKLKKLVFYCPSTSLQPPQQGLLGTTSSLHLQLPNRNCLQMAPICLVKIMTHFSVQLTTICKIVLWITRLLDFFLSDCVSSINFMLLMN
jgi:hypothetical protein